LTSISKKERIAPNVMNFLSIFAILKYSIVSFNEANTLKEINFFRGM
jgi:hypothetical protein